MPLLEARWLLWVVSSASSSAQKPVLRASVVRCCPFKLGSSCQSQSCRLLTGVYHCEGGWRCCAPRHTPAAVKTWLLSSVCWRLLSDFTIACRMCDSIVVLLAWRWSAIPDEGGMSSFWHPRVCSTAIAAGVLQKQMQHPCTCAAAVGGRHW